MSILRFLTTISNRRTADYTLSDDDNVGCNVLLLNAISVLLMRPLITAVCAIMPALLNLVAQILSRVSVTKPTAASKWDPKQNEVLVVAGIGVLSRVYLLCWFYIRNILHIFDMILS